MYEVKLSKKALKDIDKLKGTGLLPKVKNLIDVISENPFQNPPPYEKLVGDLSKLYSRRINIKHRMVYEIDREKNIIIIHSINFKQ